MQDLEEKKKCFINPELGYINQRLINIDLDYILPDELHLLLRITDRLIENLINAAVAYDNKSNILEGPIIKILFKKCGIVESHLISMFKLKNKREFTSLTGSKRNF